MLRVSIPKGVRQTPHPSRTERLAHLAKRLEHHTRIERVLEAQRARKPRHG